MMRMVENFVCAKKHKMHTTYRYTCSTATREFQRALRAMGMRRKKEVCLTGSPPYRANERHRQTDYI